MANKLGMECKLYRCATLLDDIANTPALATWIEVTNVKDLKRNLSTREADMTTRDNDGWEATRATLKSGTVDFGMLYDTDDAGFTALQEAWDGSDEIALAVMDGDIEVGGAQGLVGNFSVTNFGINEPLAEGVTVDVTVKPSTETEWYTVSAS